MKFQTAMKDLLGALNTVASTISLTSTDMTGHFVFRKHPTDTTKFEVLTHEQFTQSSAPFIAEILEDAVDEAGSRFTMPGKGLMTLLEVISDESPDDVVIFDFKGGTVRVYPAGDPKKCYPFESLDPTSYKWFDATLASAKSVGTLSADRLKAALQAAKGFVSPEETTNPSYTVCEFQNGLLRATTGRSLLSITMPGAEKASLRIQVKQHLPSVTSFLGTSKVGDLEMLEVPDRMFFLRRGDGSVLGWTLYHNPFPKLAEPKDQDNFYWKISSRLLRNAMKAVLAGAYLSGKGDVQALKFTRNGTTGPVILSATTPDKKVAEWEIPVEESGPDGDVETPVSFQVSQDYLNALLAALSNPMIRFGINQKGKNGYLRVKEVRGEDPKTADTYLFMLAWFKNA